MTDMRITWRSLNKSRRVSRSRAGSFAIILFLFVFAAFMAMPMVLIIGNSFKPLDELWIFPPKFFPTSPTLDNFRDMFNIMSDSIVPFLRYVFNTVLITVIGTAGNIVICSMCAFVLAKKRFPGSRIMFRIIVLSLMFSPSVGAVINYITLAAFRWIDTYLALIVPAVAAPLGLYLMKQFIEQIPDSLLEAARIDGASQWLIFWRIVMPNIKSAWLTLMLLSVQTLWGVGATPYIYKEELKTLPYALNQILAGGVARAGVGAAVTVFMMIVPILVFIFSQANILETMSTSGMKE